MSRSLVIAKGRVFMRRNRSLTLAVALLGCGGGDDSSESTTPVGDDTGTVVVDTATSPETDIEPTDTAVSTPDTATPPPTIDVDYTSPQRYSITFKANEADSAATQSL